MSSRSDRQHQKFRRGAAMPAAAALVVSMFGLAACGSDNNDKSSSSSGTAKPTALSVTTSDAGKGHFKMQAPTALKGGLVQMSFKNSSKAPHEAQLVRVDGSQTAKQVLDAISTNGPAKIPDWLHGEGGVATVPPGEQGSATLNLPAGHYYVTDTETGNNDKAPAPSKVGALAKLEVSGGTKGQLPQTAGTIKVVDQGKDHYAFKPSGLKAGSQKILFDNESKNGTLHHVVAFPIVGKASIADVKKAFTQQGKPSGPPPLDFTHATGTEVIDGPGSFVTTLHLKKGRYALVCFLNDRDSLKPHFLQGLLKEVDVS